MEHFLILLVPLQPTLRMGGPWFLGHSHLFLAKGPCQCWLC